jgi:hypothetical protein
MTRVRSPLLQLPLLHWSLFHRRLRLPLQMQVSINHTA